MPESPEIPDLVLRLRAGDPRLLARTITAVVEARGGGGQAEALLRTLLPCTGGARVIGLTGPPGSGKSTLADVLARRYRAAGETVGIVAVDPSSPFSGGAILGDRIRMREHHADSGLFIRSLATRGNLGGLAEAAGAVVAVLDASGKQRILVETVGVGQDEVDVVHLADVTVVVLVPGMGDAVQAIKAGLMEIADIFVINKSDRGPERLEQEIKAMLGLAPGAADDAWHPPVIKTVATEGVRDGGVAELDAAIARRLQWIDSHGGLRRRRAAQWRQRLPQFARDRLAQKLLAPLLTEARLRSLAEAVATGADPYAAVDAVIAEALGNSPTPQP